MERKYTLKKVLGNVTKRGAPLLVALLLIFSLFPALPVSATSIYTHYIYIDGVLAFQASDSDAAPDVTLTCTSNSVVASVSTAGSSGSRSYAISGSDFLGLHILEDQTTPIIPLNTPTVYVGETGANKYSYFYTVRGSTTATYSISISVDGALIYESAATVGHCPTLMLKVFNNGFYVMNEAGTTTLATYTYTGSGDFGGIRNAEDAALEIGTGTFTPGSSTFIGGQSRSVEVELTSVSVADVLAPPSLSIDDDGFLYIENADSFVTQYRIYVNEELKATVQKTGTITGFDLNTLDLPAGEKYWITASSGSASGDFSILGTSADRPSFVVWNLTGEVLYIFSGSVFDGSGSSCYGSYAFSGADPAYLTLIVTSQSVTVQYGALSHSWPASAGFLGVYDSNGFFYDYGTYTIPADATTHTLTLDFYTSFVATSDDVSYSDFIEVGNFLKTTLGSFLGFYILPGVTFGGMLAVFVVIGIIKLFFSK